MIKMVKKKKDYINIYGQIVRDSEYYKEYKRLGGKKSRKEYFENLGGSKNPDNVTQQTITNKQNKQAEIETVKKKYKVSLAVENELLNNK